MKMQPPYTQLTSQHKIHMANEELDIPQETNRSSPLARVRASIWVIIGYSFWIGFFLGAIIMHAMAK